MAGFPTDPISWPPLSVRKVVSTPVIQVNEIGFDVRFVDETVVVAVTLSVPGCSAA